MTITAQCPHCSRTYNLPAQHAGQKARCKCGQQFAIPVPAAEPELEELDDLQLEPLPSTPAPRSLPPTSNPATFPQPAFQQPAYHQAAARPGMGMNAQGLWRAGGLLVLQAGVNPLPHLCIKTGEAASSQRTEKIFWAPLWVHFTLLLGRIVHYAVMSSHGREATLRIGLSSSAALKRNLLVFGGYGVVGIGFCCFIGFGVLIASFHQEGDPIPLWPLFLGGLFIGLGALVAHFGSQLISAAAINNQFVVVRGVSHKFLASLPEWPGEIPRGQTKW